MKRNLNISFDVLKSIKLSIRKSANMSIFSKNERAKFTTRIPITPPRLEQQFWKDINDKQFQDWTREHVATLLVLDEEHGGCNLSVRDAARFWRSHFDGEMLEKIEKTANRLEKKKDIGVGVSVVTRYYNIDRNVAIKVVKWLKYLLENKFYYRWNDSQINKYCKTYNIINDINLIKKHSNFNETTINPNFFYNNWGRYRNDLNINLRDRELNVPYLKSVLNIDHLNNTINLENSSNSHSVKNRVTINGSEEEFKLHVVVDWTYYNIYSVISPNGIETQKFLSNMASKCASIIITGNSKDEILLIEHILSTFPTKRLITGCQLLLISKFIYLLKIVESDLLNDLTMNEALAYLAQCQLNTDCCEEIMKYLIDNHFDLIMDFYQTTANLQIKYLNTLKGKFPNLPNDFIICFDKCDQLENTDFTTEMPIRGSPTDFTFMQTVIRNFVTVFEYATRKPTEFGDIKNHLIFANIYDHGDTIFPTGKLLVSNGVDVNPIYIENNVTIKEFNDFFKNDLNEIELIGKLNEIIPIFPMRRDLFEKVLINLNLEYSKIGFSTWFNDNGLLSKEGVLLSNIMKLSEKSLFKEHKLIWSILTTLYSTSLQIQSEYDFKDTLEDKEKERLSLILTGYIEAFQNKSSISFRFYDYQSLFHQLARLQIIFQERTPYEITYAPKDTFSYLQAKLCYSKWCE